ncbi:hypothetical protein Tco_1028507 [Tanacetum coccineum]|uniref:Uncharacterized protein n=1 Tax=Tanacetum coccineum TaxID=301880 RepID=A0ABQ5G114_9ASTR
MSKSFEALQKHAINLELDLQQCKEKIKNDKSFKENQSNVFLKEREQYFEIQDLKAQLQDKGIAINRVMSNNSQGKKQEGIRPTFTCGKCVLNENHDLCVLHYINGVNSRTRQPMAVPISTREPKQNVNQSVATSSSRGIDLYSISLQDTTTPNPICLMAKATSSQAGYGHSSSISFKLRHQSTCFQE